MDKLIEKYEAKLAYLNNCIEKQSYLMDDTTVEMLEDVRE